MFTLCLQVALIGCLGNILCFTVFTCTFMRRLSSSIYLAALSAADFCKITIPDISLCPKIIFDKMTSLVGDLKSGLNLDLPCSLIILLGEYLFFTKIALHTTHKPGSAPRLEPCVKGLYWM